MKTWIGAALIAAFLLVPPVVAGGYRVTSVFNLVGTACDGGGGGW